MRHIADDPIVYCILNVALSCALRVMTLLGILSYHVHKIVTKLALYNMSTLLYTGVSAYFKSYSLRPVASSYTCCGFTRLMSCLCRSTVAWYQGASWLLISNSADFRFHTEALRQVVGSVCAFLPPGFCRRRLLLPSLWRTFKFRRWPSACNAVSGVSASRNPCRMVNAALKNNWSFWFSAVRVRHYRHA